MTNESNNKSLLENEMWLQEAIDNEHIKYQRYSTFENKERIGQGSMGEVYKATSTEFQKTVALKKFKISSKFTINEIINEIKLHRKVDLHDNILRFHGVTTLDPSDYGLAVKIIGGTRETNIRGTPLKYVDIYTACWNKDINCRPTISQVVKDLNDIKMNEFNEFSIRASLYAI
ncbi:7001_t:CDS:2 [Funneliformis caledonium]|uniref:7001_t:CDS:1 n=1 Tax=Funneliformis caledonium TaxID=1117310 RepID=A0A9N9HA61_9GLOM|nr:7001_t:CDS:2 [Funneliformis caledonium]